MTGVRAGRSAPSLPPPAPTAAPLSTPSPAPAPASRSTPAPAPASAAGVGGRRRLDRLLSEGYLADLEQLPLVTLRARRRAADQEQADLIYRRDLVQGRLAIVRAEAARRATGRPPADLLRRLPEILAAGTGTGTARVNRHSPNLLDQSRRLEDRLLADTAVPEVQLRADEDLATLIATLEEMASVLARRLRRVDEVLDLLGTELTRRYRTGAASAEDLLRDRETGLE